MTGVAVLLGPGGPRGRPLAEDDREAIVRGPAVEPLGAGVAIGGAVWLFLVAGGAEPLHPGRGHVTSRRARRPSRSLAARLSRLRSGATVPVTASRDQRHRDCRAREHH